MLQAHRSPDHQPPLAHGTRRTYQGGCACLQCRRANSAYSAALRQAKAKGLIPMGRHVDATEMWAQIKALRTEKFSYAEIARRLGLPSPRLRLHHERVTVRSFLRVRRLYQRIMLEGDEL